MSFASGPRGPESHTPLDSTAFSKPLNERSVFRFDASMDDAGGVTVSVAALEKGYGDLVFSVLLVAPGGLRSLLLQGVTTVLPPETLAFAGSLVTIGRSPSLRV